MISEVMATGVGKKAPVCKVCGDESSGFHYGVDSCEGCKGFFRRCITQGMHHRCNNGEKCEITPFTRNSCQYCRLKKCFAVGMSREASRLGRRPKKMKDPCNEGVKTPPVNIPIAPYPNQAELYQMRMSDLKRVLEQNGTFNSELMEAFIAAQHVYQNGTLANVDIKPVMPQIGTESGYSSLSSPSSSKSQSPIHVGQTGQMMQSTAGNIHSTSMQNVVSPHTPINSHEMRPAMVIVKEEPELNGYVMCNGHNGNGEIIMNGMPDMHLVNGASDMSTVNGIPDMAVINGDFVYMNGTPDMTALMPDVMHGDVSNMDDSGMADMDIGTAADDNCNMVPEKVDNPGHQLLETTEMPLLLPTNNTIPTPSPLQGNPFFGANVFDIRRIFEIVQTPMSDTRAKLIGIVTQAIMDAHFATCTTTQKRFEDGLKIYNQKRSLTTLADFQELDVDPTLMWQQFIACMVPEITLVVKFCKKLPGFQELTQDDQILLIKQGSFEVLLVRYLLLIDLDTDEMFDPSMQVKCSRQIAVGMPMGTFIAEFFKIADKFNPLKLNDAEMAIFAAVSIMCPDRQSLFNRKNVAKIQSLFFQALYMQLKINHKDYDRVFHSLLNVIPSLHQINEQHSMALNNMKMMSPLEANEFPALHQEVFDGNV